MALVIVFYWTLCGIITLLITLLIFRVPQGNGWKGIALSSELGYRNTLMFQIQANSKKGFNSVIGVDDLQLTGCQGKNV